MGRESEPIARPISLRGLAISKSFFLYFFKENSSIAKTFTVMMPAKKSMRVEVKPSLFFCICRATCLIFLERIRMGRMIAGKPTKMMSDSFQEMRKQAINVEMAAKRICNIVEEKGVNRRCNHGGAFAKDARGDGADVVVLVKASSAATECVRNSAGVSHG